ncbi:hypothetical protein ACIQVE_28750 [Pseudomonas sp. NPDC098747]|uniref:hypothetical protein n=1 Tax=Pseudomonas sp. NPDC098747 TaxID=3364487 RepID=UPI003839FF9D
MNRSKAKAERSVVQSRNAGAAIRKAKRLRAIKEYAKANKVTIAHAMIHFM